MKRAFSFLLALALTLSMTACGILSSEAPKGEYKPLEQEQTETETNGPETTGTTEPEATETETTEPETAEAEEPAEAEPEEDSFALGTMQGGVYENPYVGYGCVLDENWAYKTAEELQDISDLTQAIFEEGGVDIAAYSQITDMMAERLDPISSINIQYTALSAEERLAHMLVGDEGIIDATMEQKDVLISTYAQLGLEVSSLEKISVTFCGEQRWAIRTEATIQGIPYYLIQVFDTNIGPYFVTLTLATFEVDATEELLALFYSLD